MRAVLAALLVFALALSVLLPPPTAAQQLFGAVTGPTALGPRGSARYNVTITGGPSGDVNYTVDYFLRGTDLTGGAPQESTPGRTTGNQTILRIDITAPEQEQTITLVVKINARAGGVDHNTTVQTQILVLGPIVLGATFRNGASTTALNVTVRFFVDDVLVGTRTIARIDPTGQASVSLEYLPVGLQPGAHRVRIEADLDGDGTIEPARGEVVVSQVFYREAPSLSQGLNLILGIVVFLVAFLFTAGWRRRKQTA